MNWIALEPITLEFRVMGMRLHLTINRKKGEEAERFALAQFRTKQLQGNNAIRILGKLQVRKFAGWEGVEPERSGARPRS